MVKPVAVARPTGARLFGKAPRDKPPRMSAASRASVTPPPGPQPGGLALAAQQPGAEDEVPNAQETPEVGTLAHAQPLDDARGRRDQRQPEPQANPTHRSRQPVLVHRASSFSADRRLRHCIPGGPRDAIPDGAMGALRPATRSIRYVRRCTEVYIPHTDTHGPTPRAILGVNPQVTAGHHRLRGDGPSRGLRHLIGRGNLRKTPRVTLGARPFGVWVRESERLSYVGPDLLPLPGAV